ncbi:MAG TPA: hypothetical protein VF701_12255 [Thermoanaerobaculia bacterium]
MGEGSREEQGAVEEIREILFGDVALEEWGHGERDLLPWAHFAEAADRLTSSDAAGAIASLRAVLDTPDLESRHYLQAWHHLRLLGVPCEGDSERVLGVVVEVGLDDGPALLAAYADRSARFFNSSGTGIIWDRPDSSLDGRIDELLTSATAVIPHIGPCDGPRPAAPAYGDARISMLTPGGLYFGQAPVELLAGDEMGGPSFHAAVALMKALIEIEPA